MLYIELTCGCLFLSYTASVHAYIKQITIIPIFISYRFLFTPQLLTLTGDNNVYDTAAVGSMLYY